MRSESCTSPVAATTTSPATACSRRRCRLENMRPRVQAQQLWLPRRMFSHGHMVMIDYLHIRQTVLYLKHRGDDVHVSVVLDRCQDVA